MLVYINLWMSYSNIKNNNLTISQLDVKENINSYFLRKEKNNIFYKIAITDYRDNKCKYQDKKLSKSLFVSFLQCVLCVKWWNSKIVEVIYIHILQQLTKTFFYSVIMHKNWHDYIWKVFYFSICFIQLIKLIKKRMSLQIKKLKLAC